MVHIIPLVGAAALFAQTALAAAVPLRRTYDSGNSYNSNNNNNYNGGNNVYQQSSNQYDSSSNSYNSNSNNNNYGSNYNQYQQESNQYQNNNNMDMNMNESSSSSSENQYYNNQYEASTSSEYQQQYQYTSTVEEQSMETSTMEEYQQYQYDTSTESAMEEATSTSQYQAYETSSSQYSMPSYGSGSNNWNGYNNCVQQCMTQFGAPPSSMNMDSQDSIPPPSSSGAVHTVLVAPDGAGLRYVPFAVNASIGDTIRYVWTTPANHTVTLSSALAICNKSGIAEQRDFVSGVRNASQGMQVFDVTVQTEEPQFFYCSVLQHCQKGMFGIVNPGGNVGGSNTVGTMMSSLMQNNPQLQAAYSYMSANITGTTAENWGMNIPLDGIPESQYEEVAANILFTQSTFALNQGMLEGNEGASNPDGSPVQIPQGLNVLLSNTAATTPSADLPSQSTVTPAATGSLTPVNAVTGAGFSTRSVSTWLAVVVGLAGWMLI